MAEDKTSAATPSTPRAEAAANSTPAAPVINVIMPDKSGPAAPTPGLDVAPEGGRYVVGGVLVNGEGVPLAPDGGTDSGKR